MIEQAGLLTSPTPGESLMRVVRRLIAAYRRSVADYNSETIEDRQDRQY